MYGPQQSRYTFLGVSLECPSAVSLSILKAKINEGLMEAGPFAKFSLVSKYTNSLVARNE
jgi:hypothetical protein